MKRAGILAALLITAFTVSVSASGAFGQVWVYGDQGLTGAVLQALATEECYLLVGGPEYRGGGWLAYTAEGGSVLWTSEEDETRAFLCAAALPGGGCGVLANYFDEDLGADSLLSVLHFFNAKGSVFLEAILPQHTKWLSFDGQGVFAIGSSPDPAAEGGSVYPQSILRLDYEGYILWEKRYTQDGYEELMFQKGLAAGDILLVMASAVNTRTQARVGLLCRLNLMGEVLWLREFAVDGEAYLADACLAPENLITGVYAAMRYEDDGFPLDRVGTVFSMNLDGELLWEYTLQDGRAADWILPVKNGLLVASQGLSMLEDPYQGQGWVMLLSPEGQPLGENQAPNLAGSLYELTGISLQADGTVLLGGNLMQEPGFPSAPYMARLYFPAALE
ncbi:MAG: hypothetical protein PHP02_04085 [Eubacteriales bacterium]|nr:hypothetical protein [Eubacteriales bacterium]